MESKGTLLSVVYFSRGTLLKKRVKGHYWGTLLALLRRSSAWAASNLPCAWLSAAAKAAASASAWQAGGEDGRGAAVGKKGESLLVGCPKQTTRSLSACGKQMENPVI